MNFYRASFSVTSKKNSSTVKIFPFFRSNVPIILAEQMVCDFYMDKMYEGSVKYNEDFEVLEYYNQMPKTNAKPNFISQLEASSFKNRNKK